MRKTLQLSSHNVPINIKDQLLSCGSTIAIFVSFDNLSDSGRDSLLCTATVSVLERITEGLLNDFISVKQSVFSVLQ